MDVPAEVIALAGSLPPRGAWIEIPCKFDYDRPNSESLPPRGAWIEILHGHRGPAQHHRSLPPRGAWIEIAFSLAVESGNESLPPRGAWIEMPCCGVLRQ